MTLPEHRPATKSRTRRNDLAHKARQRLARYRGQMDAKVFQPDEPSTSRLSDLLWARAFIDQALAAETQGRLGDFYATVSSEADEASGIMARRAERKRVASIQ
jgi:hypothetical protein